MKNTTVFLDTNIVIDYLQNREPFAEYVNIIFGLCKDKKISAYISAQTISDTFYILRKAYTIDERKMMLLGICKMVGIIGANKTMVVNALTNEDFDDVEDCIQAECAKTAGAEYIITRNIKDFEASEVKPILPEEFLELIKE